MIDIKIIENCNETAPFPVKNSIENKFSAFPVEINKSKIY